MKQIRTRLTYANVMSSIAVFLVLGGAAFAAVQLPKNSVGTKQLKKNAVNSAKVKNNSLTGADINASTLGTVPSATNASHAVAADKATSADTVLDGAVTTNKLAPNAVTEAKIANEAVSNGKLQNESVNGSKVADRSLTADDVTQDSGQETYDFPSIAAGSCTYDLVQTSVPDLTGYLLFASPGNAGGWPSDVIINPYLSNLAGYLRIRACNVGTAAADPPSSNLNWAVMKVA